MTHLFFFKVNGLGIHFALNKKECHTNDIETQKKINVLITLQSSKIGEMTVTNNWLF